MLNFLYKHIEKNVNVIQKFYFKENTFFFGF